jgi:hypothetical protein
MLPQTDQYTLSNLKANADIIEEVSALITYVGIIKPGTTGTDEQKAAAAVWSIIKIVQAAADGTYPNITSVKYADGMAVFNKIWNNRATYDYIFKVI